MASTVMYKKVKELYLQGRLDEREVKNAVKKKWITEEKDEIILSKKDTTKKKG